MDDAQSGRPVTSHNDESANFIPDTIRGDRRMTIRDVMAEVGRTGASGTIRSAVST
jgi:hypothetical protein